MDRADVGVERVEEGVGETHVHGATDSGQLCVQNKR